MTSNVNDTPNKIPIDPAVKAAKEINDRVCCHSSIWEQIIRAAYAEQTAECERLRAEVATSQDARIDEMREGNEMLDRLRKELAEARAQISTQTAESAWTCSRCGGTPSSSDVRDPTLDAGKFVCEKCDDAAEIERLYRLFYDSPGDSRESVRAVRDAVLAGVKPCEHTSEPLT